MTRIKAWRFFAERDGKIVSKNGNLEWPLPKGSKPGAWVTHTGPIVLCESGLHGSESIQNALSERQGFRFGQVEAEDVRQWTDTKFAAGKMRIVALYSRRHVVGLGVIGAALSLRHFERKYPKDDRPRKAILAAIIGYAAHADYAAYADHAAAYAAAGAAYAAHAAAYAANAAYAAAGAAYAAHAAAYAAHAAAYRKEFTALAEAMLELQESDIAAWLLNLLEKQS